MPDLAHLHITVSSDEVVTATDSLDELGASAKKSESSVVSLGKTSQTQMSVIGQSCEKAATEVILLNQALQQATKTTSTNTTVVSNSENELERYTASLRRMSIETKLAENAQRLTAKAAVEVGSKMRVAAEHTASGAHKAGAGLGHLVESAGLSHRSIHKLTQILFIAQGAAAGAEHDVLHLASSLLTAALFGNKLTVGLTLVAAAIGYFVGRNHEAEEQAKKTQEAVIEQMRAQYEKTMEAREAVLLLADAEKARKEGRETGSTTDERKRRKEIEDIEEQVTSLKEAKELHDKIASNFRLASSVTSANGTGLFGLRAGIFGDATINQSDVKETQSASRATSARYTQEIVALERQLGILKVGNTKTDEEENKALRERAILHTQEIAAINSSRDGTLASLQAIEEGRNGSIAAAQEEITALESKRTALSLILKMYGGENVEIRRQLDLLDAQIDRSTQILGLTKTIDDADRERNRRNFLGGVSQTEKETRSTAQLAIARKALSDVRGDRQGTISAQQRLTILEAELSKTSSLLQLESKMRELRDPKKRPAGVTDEDVTRFEAAERAKIFTKYASDRVAATSATTVAQRDLNRALSEEAFAVQKIAMSKEQSVAELRAQEQGQDTKLTGMKFEIAALEKERALVFATASINGGLNDAEIQRIALLTTEIDKQKTILGILTEIDAKEKERLRKEFDRGIQGTKLDTSGSHALSQARLSLEAAKAVTFGNPNRISQMEKEVEVLGAQIERSKALFDLETKLIELRDPKRHPELDSKRLAAFEATERARIEQGFVDSLSSSLEKQRLAEVERVAGFVRDIGQMLTGGIRDAIIDGIYEGFDNIGDIALQLSKGFLSKVLDSWLEKGLNSVLTSTFSGGGGGVLGVIGNLFGGQGSQFEAAAVGAGATFTASTSVATTTFVTGVELASAGLVTSAAQAAALLAAGSAGGGGTTGGIGNIARSLVGMVGGSIGGGGGGGGGGVSPSIPLPSP